MISALLVAVATALPAEEAPAPMIAPPFVFPLIAAAFFILAAIISYSFRDVSNRHSDKTSGSTAGAHDDHGSHH